MNKKEEAVIKQSLETRKEEIKKQLLDISEENPLGVNNYNVKMEDSGKSEDEDTSEVENYTNSLSLKDSLKQTLDEVELALKKIKTGHYGICENCGKEISAKRLKAEPTARICLNCGKKSKK